MKRSTFSENFNNAEWPAKTYLCYEVDVLEGDDSWIPLDEFKGFLRNQVTDHILGNSGRSF